jgi:hypothetical protein
MKYKVFVQAILQSGNSILETNDLDEADTEFNSAIKQQKNAIFTAYDLVLKNSASNKKLNKARFEEHKVKELMNKIGYNA